MSIVTLTVNDKLISAPTDATLLDTIKEEGIEMPTLCHLKGLSERGGCRLCLVEVGDSPRLFASCVTPVAKGMKVRTHTERLLKYRQMIIELLLAERNHICAVCVQNGYCELQTLAAKLGVTSVRYDYLCPDLPVDASHERYVLDHNRCILCGRCNRVCDEVEGAHTLDLGGRGIESRVITGMNQRWGNSRSCTDCGKCVQVCPTGALFKKGSKEKAKQLNWLMWILDGRQKKHWHWS